MIRTDGYGCSLYFNKDNKKNKFQEGYKRKRKSKTEDEYLDDAEINRKIKLELTLENIIFYFVWIKCIHIII